MTKITLRAGDIEQVLKTYPDAYFAAGVTDPPYEIGFMGKTWDKSGISYSVEMWREWLRVLKPGAHLLAFGGSRTYHRLAGAIEDAGFEIRDQKPLALMRYLVRLVTSPGGLVLDGFCGSGSTLIAAGLEGFDAVGIDLSAEYCALAARRCRGHLGILAEINLGEGRE